MDFVYDLVVVAHFLGLAALVGGYFTALSDGRSTGPVPNRVLLWGARAQLLTGLALVGLAEAVLDADVDHARVGVKLAVALVVAALAEIASGRHRRGAGAPAGLVHGAGVLAIVNVLVATLWG